VKKNDIRFQSSLNKEHLANNLRLIFVAGRIDDNDLERRIVKLSSIFKVYIGNCHVPVWSEDLAVTDEISRISETYLPYQVIQQALLRLISKSLLLSCLPPLLVKADGWLRLLEMLHSFNASANPAFLIEQLKVNEAERLRFLFSVFMPNQFGGSFGRYPQQTDFIRRFVRSRYDNNLSAVKCLDAACGSGEGTYELASVINDCGVDKTRVKLTGITINALEVFAAAHAYFPHDPLRELHYREFVSSVYGNGKTSNIHFMTGDLKFWESSEQYDIILCNGILGGPIMHERREIENVTQRLASTLNPGGILLAADRFHCGWKKKLPKAEMEVIFKKCGLEVMQVSEGVAGKAN